MYTDNLTSQRRLTRLQLLALWAGILLPIGAWQLQFAASYALVPWLCQADRTAWVLALFSLVGLLAIAGGLGCAWSTWRCKVAEPPGEDLLSACCRFMGLLGMLLGIVFAVAIVGQALPMFLIHPCT